MSENKADIISILDPAYCECHEIIMNPLKDDLMTLYSCILVNRSFCRVFIPILWRNPFKFVKDDDQLVQIFNTLIHCLHPSDKNDLIHKELFKMDDLPTSQVYFKYHTLIKEFELNPLQKGIRLWSSRYLSKKLTRRSVSRRVIKLNKYIGDLLFDQENQYESLNIYYNELLNGIKNLFDICDFENHKKSLINVNKLSLGLFHGNTTKLILPITKNILKLQNSLSPNIQHLQISIDTFKDRDELSKNLIDFIKNQEKLKSLSTNIFWKNDKFIQPFLNSLKKQSNCLTFLKLQDSTICNDLLLSILSCLPNLIILELDFAQRKFNNDHDMDLPPLNNLEHLHYNYDLSTVFMPWSSWPTNNKNRSLSLFQHILSSSNNKLKSLKIKDNFLRHIQIIPQHLTHFHLILISDTLDNVTTLLKNLHQLIHLKLDSIKYPDCLLLKNYFSFKQFSQTIPDSLKILETNLKITDGYLEWLLNETQLQFQCIKLYSYIHYNTSFRIFIDYAKRNKCFKELGLTYNIMKSIPKDNVKEARNYFNITTFTDDEINKPFYDEPIKNSYWSKRVNENSTRTVPRYRPERQRLSV
ncbi:hypothetical protein C1645_825466 [Glomus cerebriforme]|uniref:F-box domain-containing protein n=1 Tax=Glomus cerebriforme TaxID=658196 RepID=A0A397STH9_9GLOM|nr:hypothetical protein C1645_825466 [Glomus cerebriforme]